MAVNRGKSLVKKDSPTSITLAEADNFLRDSPINAELSCKKVPGFHLRKQSTGGRWRWRYTDPMGARKKYTIGSYSRYKPHEAAEIAIQLIEAEADPIREKQARRNQRKAEIITAETRTLGFYLTHHYSKRIEREWKQTNASLTLGRIRNHFADLLDRDMATLTKEDIRAWEAKEEMNSAAYSSRKRNFTALKAVLQEAVKDNILTQNPLKGVKLEAPTITEQESLLSDPNKEKRRMLTPDEIQQIQAGLNAFGEKRKQERRNSRAHGKPDLPDLDTVPFPHWFIPFCITAMHTGMAPADLFSLSWDEVNFRFGNPEIRRKREKTKHLVRNGKKPVSMEIPLSATLFDALQKWNKQNASPLSGLVFPSPVTGKKLSDKALRTPWRTVKKLGGINPSLDFYALRHHFISAQLAAGIPIFEVAKLAGHKSVDMIMEHYGHLCPQKAKIAIDVIDQSFSATDTKAEVI